MAPGKHSEDRTRLGSRMVGQAANGVDLIFGTQVGRFPLSRPFLLSTDTFLHSEVSSNRKPMDAASTTDR